MSDRPELARLMWIQACALVEQTERLQRHFFRLGAAAPAAWEPPLDVFENDDEWLVVVAMPGVPPERVQVHAESGAVVVRGTRALPHAAHRLRRLEIPYGAFERRIALPPGEFELGAPELADGCLTLRLRKRREAGRR